MEAAGFPCRVVHNPEENIKVTYPGDMALLNRHFPGRRQ